jgi:hypothetical protein
MDSPKTTKSPLGGTNISLRAHQSEELINVEDPQEADDAREVPPRPWRRPSPTSTTNQSRRQKMAKPLFRKKNQVEDQEVGEVKALLSDTIDVEPKGEAEPPTETEEEAEAVGKSDGETVRISCDIRRSHYLALRVAAVHCERKNSDMLEALIARHLLHAEIDDIIAAYRKRCIRLK